MLDARHVTIAAMIAGMAALGAPAAQAQSQQRIGQFNDWGAIGYQSSNGRVCYVVSVPLTQQPSNVRHGDNFFVVTQRRGQNVTFEPQFIAGYPLREGSKVTVTVDGTPFSFFTQENAAWTDNAAEEPTLVAAMRAGARMVVEAVSSRGTETTYEYSLSGVTAALNAIESCD